MINVIILAGGVGSRVGADCPKQFIEISGKPILAYTIEIFQNNPQIDNIEVVCHKDWKKYLEDMIEKYKFTKVRWIAEGGNTFQESVMNGINYIKDKISEEDYVLIQYGAAPFTSRKIVDDVIRVTKKNGSAASTIPCYQLMGSNDGEVSNNWIDRDKYVQIACPQGFKMSYLVDIYKRAAAQGLIEKTEPHTTSLMYALGDKIYQAYGDQTNIKITTEADLELFKGYVLLQEKGRVSK